MSAIDDDAQFFARFSAEASNSAIEAIQEALSDATGERLDQSQKADVARLLLEGFERVKNVGRIGSQDSETATLVLMTLNLNEEDCPHDLVRGVRDEVVRAFGNFAESLAEFYDRELRRRERRSTE